MNKDYVKRMVCFDESLEKAQKFVKEEYGIESQYNEKDNVLNLWCDSIQKTNQLIKAQQYVTENVGEDLVQIQLGKN